MLIDKVIEFVIHSFDDVIAHQVIVIWFNLKHRFLDIVFEVPGNNWDELFFIVLSKDLNDILFSCFYQLDDLSIRRKLKIDMLEASFFISSKKAFSLDHEFKLMAIFQLLWFIILGLSSIFQHITLIDDNKIVKVVFGIHLDCPSVFNGMEGSDQIIVFCVVLNVRRVSLLYCFYVI